MNEPMFWVENLARLLMLAAGVGVAAHYHLMANFMQRAPHGVKLLVSVASFGGVGMIACATTGQLIGGLLATCVAMSAVILINLAAWDAGMHVSRVFDDAAQAAQKHMGRTRQMVRAMAGDADGVGNGLEFRELPVITPNGWREIDASDQRAAWREGEKAAR